jgi:hypothetical protein
MKIIGDRNEEGKIYPHSGIGHIGRIAGLSLPIREYLPEGHRGVGDFVAPVYLPPGARIRMIKLFAYDTNTGTNLCAALYESYPKVGGNTILKYVCTTGSKGFQQPIGYLSHYMKWYYSYYILLEFPGSGNLATTAVILKYTINR